VNRIVLALVLALSTGCTAAQVQTAESEAHAAVVAAQRVVADAQANKATLEDVAAALARVTTSTGQAHAAAVSAQAFVASGQLDVVAAQLAAAEAATKPKAP